MRKNSKEMAANRRRKKTIGMLTSGLKSVVKWKIIVSSIMLLLLGGTSHVLAVRKGRLMSPSTFTALSGDLHVQIQFNGNEMSSQAEEEHTIGGGPSSEEHLSSSDGLKSRNNTIMSTLVISKIIDEVESPLEKGLTPGPEVTNTSQVVLHRKRKEVVQNIPLFPDPRFNVTQVTVPCQTFLIGGRYEMQVVSNLKSVNRSEVTTTLVPAQDERLHQTLDVRWPSAEMIVSPVRLKTYPKHPVEVTLRFPEVNCNQSGSLALPEFWLELIYCGKDRSCNRNITPSSVLFAEQIRGFPKNKSLHLGCELFGLAGNYAVQLRPMIPAQNVPTTRRLLSVDWSDEFVFNVYARSIFPCDPHTGIGVLYEYPGCILEQGDRVRLYARLRADVASLKPPTSLHYVSEQRVVKSQHSLYFACEHFSEKYVEYCFVYVSQAISGAVADVRMDCVPTLPVSDSDTGGWGPWSEWTPCSTNCLGGTRNRYRFCDSPPPRYGAKFCEGPSVETQKCGKSIADTWDCIYETSGTVITKENSTEVSQEIGPGCRCGCIVHLGSSKPKRIIAGATQSCPGRSFWLIQVDGEESISLALSFLRLPCATQYIKVRDGPSLSSTLLVELNGGGLILKGAGVPVVVDSTGGQLLVEFSAGDAQAGNATQEASAACTGGFMANVQQQLATRSSNSSTTLVAATRLSGKTRSVAHKSMSRLRFTLVHLSAMIFASIIIIISSLLGAQYVVRYRKYHLAVARRQDEGSRLHTPRASLSSLQGPPSRAMSTTTLLSEVIYMVKMRPKHHLRHSILRESVDAENLTNETEFKESDSQGMLAKCAEIKELGSSASMVTLRNERSSPARSLDTGSIIGSPSSAEAELAAVHSRSEAKDSPTDEAIEPPSCKDSAKDSESIISSGMSSLCNSPPMNSKRLSKYSDRYDAVTLKLLSSRLDESLQDASSLLSVTESFRLGRLRTRSVSSSLTNGCYSPAASVVSTATIRTTSNPKESKEKQNRRKLLARPGSEFSLGNQEELEMDYYDYNVINAGSAPGSYLGMDPAYLIWIPPFEEVAEREEDDKTPEPEPDPERDERQPLYEEIRMPKYGHYLSPASNTESSKSTTADNTPSSEERSPPDSGRPSKATSPCDGTERGGRSMPKQPTPFMSMKQRGQSKQQMQSSLSLSAGSLDHEQRRSRKVPIEIGAEHLNVETELEPNDSMTGSYVEKETAVEKSSGDLQEFLSLDDIQFADESGSDYEAVNLKKVPKSELQLNQDDARSKLLRRREPKSKEVAV
ncbi:GD12205 [Drosophila simulans]|uniref:GD12205 n=1 Tax=Drosophila simulans TaxID=7240 RepID=B4QRW0_DROSI|nr:GD12205 [Drosophila simulans]